MAEERISINFIPDDPCNGCEVEQECPFDCPEKKEYDRCMTRQEAIEKMAKGIVSILQVEPGTEPDPWEIWKDYAEAALDALLDEKNI